MAKARRRVPAVRKPGAPERRLAAFVGRWRTRGRTTDGTDVEIDCRDEYRWLPGGFFVVHRWNGRVGSQRVHGLEVIGHDAKARAYRTRFFDGGGAEGTERMTVRGRTWTWLGRGVMGAAWHRCVSVLTADGRRFVARHERSANGRTWSPWMIVTLTRRGAAEVR
jgi:hypothetical protein